MEELASGQRTLVMLHTAAECMLHGLRQKGVAPGREAGMLESFRVCWAVCFRAFFSVVRWFRELLCEQRV